MTKRNKHMYEKNILEGKLLHIRVNNNKILDFKISQ